MKYKNILLTGGAGFIGSHLALKLEALGHKVTVLDSLSAQIHGAQPETDSPLYQKICPHVHFIHGDICDAEKVREAVENQDAVIHLAAETGTGQSMYEISRYTKTNVYGTSVLLDVLANEPNKIKKIILASSRAVYGEGKYKSKDGKICFPAARAGSQLKRGNFEPLDEEGRALTALATDENSKLQPVSVYGLTKLQQEELLTQICPALGIEYVILRYQNVYGAGQSLRNAYTGILSIFSTQILSGKSLNIFEDGRPTRDFIHVDDTVNATMAALYNEKAANETINVGTGAAISVLEVAELLSDAYGKESDLRITGNFRVGDIRHNFADVQKMRELLDYAPQISFAEGLKEFTAWVKTQKLPGNHYEKSILELKNKGFLK